MPDAIVLEDVTVLRRAGGARRAVLAGVDWRVAGGEHWGVLGPNGGGKSTLLRIASAQMRPSRGSATILGGRLGRVSMPELRKQIGVVEPALGRRFHPEQLVLEVVATGADAVIFVPQLRQPAELERAQQLLRLVGAAGIEAQPFATCSEGERTRVLLARALMPAAQLLVLDEPAAGLDVGGRELLLEALEAVARERPGLTTVTVTQHVEELSPTTTHLLLLREGAVLAAGPVAETATDEALSGCFGTPLRVERADGRLFVSGGGRRLRSASG